MDVYEKARIKRRDAPQWKKQLADELLASRRKRFKRRHVFSPSVDSIWTGDLMFMENYARENKGYKYILVILDVFSRFAWTRPLKDKTASTTAKAFQEILQTTKSPQKLWCDLGTEFTGASFKRVLQQYDIKFYHTYNDVKASIAERFIRTLRRKLESDFILTHSTVWYGILPQLTYEYNTSIHRTIKMSPEDARKPENFVAVYKNLYSSHSPPTEVSKFKVGDKVRISLKKRTFQKETGNWSEEIFEVTEVLSTTPVVYKIKDLSGEEIHGTFYKEQLQKTDQNIYRIDRILRRRRKANGNVEVLVKWYNWPEKFNSWEPEEVIHTSGNGNQ